MDFIEIVKRVLRNETLTDQELDALVLWMMSEESRPLLDEGLMRLLEDNASAGEGQFDCQSALTELYGRIERQRIRPRRSRLYRMAAAAVAVVAVAGAAIFLGQRLTVQDGGDILPGSHVAVLELNDGRRVSLTDFDGNTIEQRGAVATVAAGELKYSDAAAEAESAHTAGGEQLYNSVTIPRGGEYKVVLTDGTAVWLNSESVLRFPPAFTGSQRRVYLEGEAYFEVAEDAGKPFTVETKDQTLTVLGTEFNVQAYSDEGHTTTTLVGGSVEVVSKATAEHRRLEPGQQSQLNAGSGIFTLRRVDAEDYVSWRSGLFVFDDHSLEQVMNKLARWYDINVTFDNPAAGEIIFKGNLPKYENLQTLLDIIEKISPAKFEVSGRSVRVAM